MRLGMGLRPRQWLSHEAGSSGRAAPVVWGDRARRFTTDSFGGQSGMAEDVREKAEKLFQEGLKAAEKPTLQNKAANRLRAASELGHVEALCAYGRVLLEQADADEDGGNRHDASSLVAQDLLPTVDAAGRPTGGLRDGHETKLEIIRIRNKNKRGTKKNKRELGVQALKAAALEKGHVGAKVALANTWFQNERNRTALKRSDLNEGDAIQLYVDAAEQGHVDAMFNLAMLYSDGTLPREPDTVLKWLKIAAEDHNDPTALFTLGRMLMEEDDAIGKHGQHEHAFEDGADLVMEAASKKYSRAQVYVAQFLEQLAEEQATLEEKNAFLDMAKSHLEEALAKEDPDALFWAATLYSREEGSYMGNEGVDYISALRLFERAGVAGKAEAWTSAGAMHYNGLGTPKDYLEAYRAYEQGAKLGSLEAFRNIAAMYAKGDEPLGKNEDAAKEILKAVEAAEASQQEA